MAKITIGAQFIKRGKNKDVWTIVDIWTTYNNQGSQVKKMFVCSKQGPFNVITDYDVNETTIRIGMAELQGVTMWADVK